MTGGMEPSPLLSAGFLPAVESLDASVFQQKQTVLTFLGFSLTARLPKRVSPELHPRGAALLGKISAMASGFRRFFRRPIG